MAGYYADEQPEAEPNYGRAFIELSIALGVGYAAMKVYGIWWGLVYALFWETWLAFRIADYLFHHF